MARRDTPDCKKCGRKHDNFKHCPQLAGVLVVGGFDRQAPMTAPEGYEQSPGWGKGLMRLSETSAPVTWLNPAPPQGGVLTEPPEWNQPPEAA